MRGGLKQSRTGESERLRRRRGGCHTAGESIRRFATTRGGVCLSRSCKDFHREDATLATAASAGEGAKKTFDRGSGRGGPRPYGLRGFVFCVETIRNNSFYSGFGGDDPAFLARMSARTAWRALLNDPCDSSPKMRYWAFNRLVRLVEAMLSTRSSPAAS